MTRQLLAPSWVNVPNFAFFNLVGLGLPGHILCTCLKVRTDVFRLFSPQDTGKQSKGRAWSIHPCIASVNPIMMYGVCVVKPKHASGQLYYALPTHSQQQLLMTAGWVAGLELTSQVCYNNILECPLLCVTAVDRPNNIGCSIKYDLSTLAICDTTGPWRRFVTGAVAPSFPLAVVSQLTEMNLHLNNPDLRRQTLEAIFAAHNDPHVCNDVMRGLKKEEACVYTVNEYGELKVSTSTTKKYFERWAPNKLLK